MSRTLTSMEKLWLADIRRIADLYETAQTDGEALIHTTTALSLWSSLRGFLLQKIMNGDKP